MNDSLAHPTDDERQQHSDDSSAGRRAPIEGIRKLNPGEEGPQSEIIPLPDGRFLFRGTIDQETYDLILYVRELVADEIPAPDLGQLIELALDAAIEKLEGGDQDS